MKYDLILGIPTLTQLGFSLKPNCKSFFILGQTKIKWETKLNKIKLNFLRLKSKIILQPLSEIKVYVKNPISDNSAKCCLIEQHHGNENFALNSALVQNIPCVPILLSNLTQNILTLHKNRILGNIKLCPSEDLSTLVENPDYENELNNVSVFHNSRKKWFNESTIPDVTIGQISVDQKATLESVLIKYNRAFTYHKLDLGCVHKYRFGINPVDKSKVTYIPPRTIPPGVKPEADIEFARWVKQGLVEESTSDYNSPVLIIRKGAKKEARIVIDLRAVNNNTLKERTPIPNIHSIFYELGVKIRKSDDYYISVCDFSKAYHQMRLADDTKKFSAFSYGGKSYQSTRLLYGYANAPSSWTKMMQKIFKGIDLNIFFDDVIFVSSTFEEHEKTLIQFLSRCIEFGLLLDPKKCNFFMKEATILGEQINGFGRTPSEKHILAIKNYPRPHNKKSLKQFLGLVAWVSRHIKGSSADLNSLYKLTSPNATYDWSDDHEKIFQNFKDLLSKPELGIAHRNEAYPLILVTDASGEKCAGILYQQNTENILEPLSYYSRVFTGAEKRQSSRTRELIALSDSIKHCEFFVIGQEFTCITDHKSLIYLHQGSKMKTLTPRLVNIMIFLQKFNFVVKFKPNTDPSIVASDSLSRAYTQSELSGEPEPTSIPDYIATLTHCPLTATANNDNEKRYFLRQSVRTETGPIKDSIFPNGQSNVGFTYSNINYTNDDIKTYQGQDTFCNLVKSRLKGNQNKIKNMPFSKTTKKKFILINDILFFKNKRNRKILVLPEKVSSDFLSTFHCANLHPGGLSLQNMVENFVYIRGLQKLAQSIVSSCEACIRCKNRPKLRPAKVPQRSFSSFPFSRTYVDLIQLKPDGNRKKFLLTFTDEMTHLMDAIPLPSKSDEQTSKALLTLILRHGAFHDIVYDRGCEWMGPILTSISKKLKITTIRTSAYNSQANIAERGHREVAVKLRLLENNGQKHWSDKVSLVLFHLNNMPRRRLDGLTPTEAAYGRCLYLPITTVDSDLPQTQTAWTAEVNKYFESLYPSLIQFQRARYNKLLQLDKNKGITLTVGDSVLFYKPKIIGQKFYSTFAGPVEVFKKISYNTYLLKDKNSGKIFPRNLRNIRLLKKVEPEPEPTDQQEIVSEPIDIQAENLEPLDLDLLFS